jgi:hypothetical protein
MTADTMTGAELLLPDAEPLPVQVSLAGAFQPIDGRFHWYGRIAADDRLPAELSGTTVVLRTAYGEAVGRLSDIDPWGRHRISGTGKPPFDADRG